jgi:Sulfotransferase family
MMSSAAESGRNRAPVFVVGCPRSGTTLLYDMLLSAGGFAVYLAESNVFNLLVPRFGDPGVESNRRRLLQVWLQTKVFRAGHIDPAPLESRLSAECHHSGDFLRIFMEEICRAQQVKRWADNSPEEILYLPLIKRLLPNALVVHIIRDGRAVAVSLNQQGWIRPLPGDQRLLASGLYWEWIVRKGRAYGKALAADYTELRFEELLANPRDTLAQLGRFLEHDLDYDRIQQVGLGSVSRPNTSFHQESTKHGFNPVGRWKEIFPLPQLGRFEEVLGNYLEELGYPLATGGQQAPSSQTARVRALYQRYFDAKLWLKNTWFYRAYYRMLDPDVNIARINYIVMADDVTRLAIHRRTPSAST